MKEKIKAIKGGWINDQIKLINKLIEETDSIKPFFKDRKEMEKMSEKERQLLTILTILEGNKGALVFRLKNSIHLIKEITGETIELPDNIKTLTNTVNDIIRIDEQGSIIDAEGNNYTKLVEKLK